MSNFVASLSTAYQRQGERERQREGETLTHATMRASYRHTHPPPPPPPPPTETTLWDRLSLRLQGKHMCVSPATQRELCPPSPVPGLLFRLLLYYNDYMCVTWLSGGPSLSLSPCYGAEATATSDNLGMWGVAGLLEIGWTDWHNIDSGHGPRDTALGSGVSHFKDILKAAFKLRIVMAPPLPPSWWEGEWKGIEMRDRCAQKIRTLLRFLARNDVVGALYYSILEINWK